MGRHGGAGGLGRLAAVAAALALSGCGDADGGAPEAAETAAPSRPSLAPPPPPGEPPEEEAAPTTAAPPAPVDLGRSVSLDERAEARVRSAIRRRVGARPTLVTARHYRTADRGTVTFAAFTAGYLERCVAGGTPREECLLGGGEEALATNIPDCVFGGVARIDLGPDDGDRPGPMQIVGVERIGDGTICAFEVESLRLVDEDRDGDPELVLRYAWSDLRTLDGERVVHTEGTVRRTLRADLRAQVELEVARVHRARADEESRNLVSQLRHLEGQGRVDLALDVIDWLAEPCPEVEAPHGREECDVRERTVVYRYDPDADAWRAP